MMGAPKWKPEEDEIVRQIHASDKTAKESAHLLPGRSHFSIMGRFQSLGLPKRGGRGRSHYRWVEEAIIRLLSAGAPLTVLEMAQATGASYHRIRVTMYEGRGTKWHVSGYARVYARGTQSPKWMLGPGEDAPQPAPLSKAETNRRDRERRKLKAGNVNPFLTAAGFVKPKEATPGRVYSQDMTIHLQDEMEAV